MATKKEKIYILINTILASLIIINISLSIRILDRNSEVDIPTVASTRLLDVSNLISNYEQIMYERSKPQVIHVYVIGEQNIAGFNDTLLRFATEDVIPEKQPIDDYTQREIDLIARVTMSEASIESFEVQVAVAQTIVNRLHSGLFGDSISEIVYAPRQYSTSDNGNPTEQIYRAVEEAINNPKHPCDMYYFRTSKYHSKTIPYQKLGVLYFSRQA